MVRSLPIALCAVLAALLIVGCGDSERLSYERDLAGVGRVVERALAELPSEQTQTIGPEQLATLAGELREAADQLSDLDPPADVSAAQRRLERGLRGVATGFDDLSAHLRDAQGDQARSELFVEFQADEGVDAAFDDILASQQAYSSEGYRVFDARDPEPPTARTVTDG